MNISKYNMYIIMDANYGISKNKMPPQFTPEWSKFLFNCTNKKSNAIIVGRKTYETLFKNNEQYDKKNRSIFVISKTYNPNEYNNIIVYKSLIECLNGISLRKNFDSVSILGGVSIFNECMKNILYLCENLYLCKIKSMAYDCDEIFAHQKILKDIPCISDKSTNMSERLDYTPSKYVIHPETQYLNLIDNIINLGERFSMNVDNKIMSFKRLYNKNVQFSLLNNIFPLLTCKYINYNNIFDDVIALINSSNFNSDCFGFRFKYNNIIYNDNNKDYSNIDDNYNNLLNIKNKLYEQKTINIVIKNSFEEFKSFELKNLPIYIKYVLSENRTYLDSYVYFDLLDINYHFVYYLTYLSLLQIIISNLISDCVIPRNIYFNMNEVILNTELLDKYTRIVNCTPKPFPILNLKTLDSLLLFNEFKPDSFSLLKYNFWNIKI